MQTQNVNYAVKASYLKNLVETMHTANVLPVNSQMETYVKRQDKVKAVRNFVFYIECYDKEMSMDGVENRPSYISTSPANLFFSEKQESKTLTISTNAQSWKIKSKPNWCTATGKTATSITINVTNNMSYESRNGTIELETNDGKFVSVYVSQSGKERPYITANTKSINFDYIGGAKVISVSTNSESWEVSSKPDWCTTNKSSTFVTINVSKNESYEFRNGIVELKTSDGKSISIYVSQSGKERPYITTNPKGVIFGDVGGQKEVSVSTNSESWKISSNPDWCVVSGSSTSKLTINAIRNDSYNSRKGTILLETNNGESVSVDVSQSGKERPYITVNPKNLNFDEKAGQKTISVSTNSWS